MKSIVYALIGTVLYAVTGVVIEQKLEKFNSTSLVLLFCLPIVPIALSILFFQKVGGHDLKFPSGAAFWIVMLLGIIYFFADYFYIGAFTAGGDVVTISTIILIVPAIAAIMK